ncbi:MAG: hypothetical protein JSV86_21600, partial [Gemmatimonadota bacterium]
MTKYVVFILFAVALVATILLGQSYGDSKWSSLDAKYLQKVKYPHMYATAGDGEACATAWTGWESAYTSAVRRLHFAAGYYKGSLNITTPVYITGDGVDQTILCNDYDGSDSSNRTITVDTGGETYKNFVSFGIEDIQFKQYNTALASGGTAFLIEEASRFTIDNVAINADFTTDITSSGTALQITDVDNGTVRDLFVGGSNDGGWYAVGVDIGNTAPEATGNVSFYGGSIGRATICIRIGEGVVSGAEINNWNFYGTKCVVNGSGIPQNGTVGFELNPQAVRNTIDGVQIEGYGDTAIELIGADGTEIRNVDIAHFAFDSSSRGITVSNNVVGLNVSNVLFNNGASYACSRSGPVEAYAVEWESGATLAQAEIGGLRFSNCSNELLDSTTSGVDSTVYEFDADSGYYQFVMDRIMIGDPADDADRKVTFQLNAGNESLSWANASTRFELSDDLYVQNDLVVDGGDLTLNESTASVNWLSSDHNTTLNSGNIETSTTGNLKFTFDSDNGGSNFLRVFTGADQALEIENSGAATFAYGVTFDSTTQHDGIATFGSTANDYLTAAAANGALSRVGDTTSDIVVQSRLDTDGSNYRFRIPVSGALRWDQDADGTFDISLAPVSTTALRLDDNNSGLSTRKILRVFGTVEADDGLQVSDGTDSTITALTVDRASTDSTITWDDTLDAFIISTDLHIYDSIEMGDDTGSVDLTTTYANNGVLPTTFGWDTSASGLLAYSGFSGTQHFIVDMAASGGGTDYEIDCIPGTCTFTGTTAIDVANIANFTATDGSFDGDVAYTAGSDVTFSGTVNGLTTTVPIVFTSYLGDNTRFLNHRFHGNFISLATAQTINPTPTNI